MKLRKLLNINIIFYNFCTGPLKTLNPTKFAGKLTILPTPIGNLQDLSPNIIKALFKADIIGCQDRRVAGKLYSLIKNRNIFQGMTQSFGQVGLSSLIPLQNNKPQQRTQQQNNYLFYDYANMNQKKRKKFLRKMTKQQQQKFKIDFLKYRALKIIQKQDQFLHKEKQDKFDQIYGIQSGDLQHIQLQIRNTRIKKGRGVLIPLNTYSETKMFNMVKMFLQKKNVAIISDAGMPCISDPGWKMVRKIRQSLPQVPIQVIGGPSTVSVMTLLASLSLDNHKGSISGRFEGFAPDQISQITQKSIQMQQAKKKQFSIHFINSKKLRKKTLELQNTFGQNQRILLANQLTKMYERKYHGTIGQLNSQMSKEDSQFQGIGQLSYIVYPNVQKKDIKQQQLKQVNLQKIRQQSKQDSSNSNNEQISKGFRPSSLSKRISLISLENFIDSIKQAQKQVKIEESLLKAARGQYTNEEIQSTRNKQKKVKGNQSQVSSKDLIDLLCSIFGTKSSQARKLVYQKQIAIKKGKNNKKDQIIDPSTIYKQQQQKQQSNMKNQSKAQDSSQQQRGRRVGRRGSKRREENFSSEEMQFLKMLSQQKGNMF